MAGLVSGPVSGTVSWACHSSIHDSWLNSSTYSPVPFATFCQIYFSIRSSMLAIVVSKRLLNHSQRLYTRRGVFPFVQAQNTCWLPAVIFLAFLHFLAQVDMSQPLPLLVLWSQVANSLGGWPHLGFKNVGSTAHGSSRSNSWWG